MDSFQDLFQLACQYCQQNLSEVAYNLWIRDIEPRTFDGSVASLYVTSEFKKNILEEKYLSLLKDAFASVVGFEVEVKLLCPGDGASAPQGAAPQQQEALFLSGGYLAFLLSFAAFSIKYPYTCSSDFRYIVVCLIYIAIGLSDSGSLYPENSRAAALSRITRIAVWATLILSAIIYMTWKQW